MTRKKEIDIEVIYAGTPEESAAIFRALIKNTIEAVLKRNGAVANNLDNVLDNFVQELIHNSSSKYGG
ncbi:hypothetical protein [Fontibacillus panacisegetis]|uniref:hypothetical protein n=1 Tax=Fontibacillus panacisegetis TaxID=670482 RepID=UPI000B8147FC|nr:hypothetical protein [Fontibacillus panacisegetis]